MKRSIPILIASLSGLVLVLAFFSPRTESWSEAVVDWFNVLAAIAFILGAGSLLKVQLVKISSRSPGWAYAAITLAAFLFTLFVGLFKVGTVPSDKFPTHAWTGDYEAPQATFGFSVEFAHDFRPRDGHIVDFEGLGEGTGGEGFAGAGGADQIGRAHV